MRRVILFIFSEQAVWRVGGGGGYAARFFFLFSFPCSADHERDWPPCKVVFSGWATSTLNVKNNKNNCYISGKIDRKSLDSRASIRRLLYLCILYFGGF